MKIRLITVGATSDRMMREAIEGYSRRVSHYIPFEIKNLPDVKAGKSTSEARQKELEGVQILSQIGRSDRMVLLDERGKEKTSREFAAEIEQQMVMLQSNLVFVVGGPYGFSPDVYSRANAMMSLTRMTMTHEMVRLLFVEQLYRAMTIIRGEPYHHD